MIKRSRNPRSITKGSTVATYILQISRHFCIQWLKFANVVLHLCSFFHCRWTLSWTVKDFTLSWNAKDFTLDVLLNHNSPELAVILLVILYMQISHPWRRSELSNKDAVAVTKKGLVTGDSK